MNKLDLVVLLILSDYIHPHGSRWTALKAGVYEFAANTFLCVLYFKYVNCRTRVNRASCQVLSAVVRGVNV